MFEGVNEEICSKVLNDLGKTKEQVEQDVHKLREWLLQRPHYPHNEDVVFLRNTVIPLASFDKMKEVCQRYLDLDNKYPAFRNRDPASIKWDSTMDTVTLPGTTPEGIKISLVRLPPKSKASKWNLIESAKMNCMNNDLIMMGNEILGGHYYVVDTANVSLTLILRTSVGVIKQCLEAYQKVFPVKAKGLFFFNCPTTAYVLFKIFLFPFLSEKLRSRVKIYTGGIDEIVEIPCSMLPKDYGGDSLCFDDLLRIQKEKYMNLRYVLVSGAGGESSDAPVAAASSGSQEPVSPPTGGSSSGPEDRASGGRGGSHTDNTQKLTS